MNTLASALNAALAAAPAPVIEAIAAGSAMPVEKSDPRAAVSTTGLIAEGALVQINKQPLKQVHYVTAQGFQNLFTERDTIKKSFLNMVQNALKDDLDFVAECMDKAVSSIPHDADASQDDRTRYSVAQARRTEFRLIYGVARLEQAILFTDDGEALYTKAESLVIARQYLADKELDWKGQSTADKKAMRAARIDLAAKKSAAAQVAKQLVTTGKIMTQAQIAELTKAAKDEIVAEASQKKLEAMRERAVKAADGLVGYYDGDTKLAIEHVEAMLTHLRSKIVEGKTAEGKAQKAIAKAAQAA